MTATIERAWSDEGLRHRLGQAARAQATQQYSNEAVGRRLAQLLDSLA
jgi:hypothetical protein